MAYLFKEKFNISDLAGLSAQPKKAVLIAEPEEYLLALYSNHLKSHNFEVAGCRHVDALYGQIKEFKPDLLLLNPALVRQLSVVVNMLSKIRNDFPYCIPVITIGYNLSNDELKQLVSAGIASHIDRKLTQPRDVVHIVKAILS